MFKDNIRKNAAKILKKGGEILADQWRENIDLESWNPETAMQGAEEFVKATGMGDVSRIKDVSKSTGRYYRSIMVEVSNDLEVHVGSNIPRPSGRGLTQVSYPELLEFGTVNFEAIPTLRPAIDEAGPAMEREMRKAFDGMNTAYLLRGTEKFAGFFE
jgi:hypothetical protein